MKEFIHLKNCYEFIKYSKPQLEKTLEDFFSAVVTICPSPIDFYQKRYNINITEHPRREVYVCSSDIVLVLSHVLDKDGDMYALGVSIESKYIASQRFVFNFLSKALSRALQDDYSHTHKFGLILYTENFINRLIAFSISKGYYNVNIPAFLIDKFNALRSTTFEGKYFSTGLILTKSLLLYKNNKNGDLLRLTTTRSVFDRIDNRFWYLSDAKSCFYVCDSSGVIRNVFVDKSNESEYLNRLLMRNVLRGGDVLFRVNNGRELSITTSRGIEYLYQENVWRYRDYEQIKKVIQNEINISDDLYYSLMYYVLSCSKNDTSALFWIPNNIDDIGTQLKSHNSPARKSFKITDYYYESWIKRMVSSDGATIIALDGTIKYYGCIVHLGAIKSGTLVGTGESAANALATNGIAIKVSQDGTIKIFINGREKPMKI